MECTSWLTQSEAIAIDNELMGCSIAFSIDQLMELAGLSVAQAVFDAYPPTTHLQSVLVVCGPGNNGGDGLVAARHLKQFGYNPSVWYPKPGPLELFKRLVAQVESEDIRVFAQDVKTIEDYDIVVDAIFGFSFRGEPREPYDAMLAAIKNSNAYVVSVDIPSGWDVELGDPEGKCITPQCLVSLTAPKMCARHFKGKHYVGGRFVPKKLLGKMPCQIPYKGSDQVILLNHKD